MSATPLEPLLDLEPRQDGADEEGHHAHHEPEAVAGQELAVTAALTALGMLIGIGVKILIERLA